MKTKTERRQTCNSAVPLQKKMHQKYNALDLTDPFQSKVREIEDAFN